MHCRPLYKNKWVQKCRLGFNNQKVYYSFGRKFSRKSYIFLRFNFSNEKEICGQSKIHAYTFLYTLTTTFCAQSKMWSYTFFLKLVLLHRNGVSRSLNTTQHTHTIACEIANRKKVRKLEAEMKGKLVHRHEWWCCY